MIWKLFRLDAFNKMHVYYKVGSKVDLFAFIGYIYSCFDVGTERIDYKRVPAIPMDECTPCLARCEGYSAAYYLKKEE